MYGHGRHGVTLAQIQMEQKEVIKKCRGNITIQAESPLIWGNETKRNAEMKQTPEILLRHTAIYRMLASYGFSRH